VLQKAHNKIIEKPMRVTEDRYKRDRRAFDLAWRLVLLGARTGTISCWTGIAERRVRAFRKSYGTANMESKLVRPRGRSPQRIELLLRSPRRRQDAIELACLLRAAGALPTPVFERGRRLFPSIERGEVLCNAFESLKANCRESVVTIEQAFLLFAALATGDEIDFAQCTRCGHNAIVDRLDSSPQRCDRCSGAFKADRGAINSST
jgi:hypothetical protein